MNKIATVAGTPFSRKLGLDCVMGNGTSQPQGILTALQTPVYSTSSGKITLTDCLSIFFSVNRIYRVQPLTGWLCSDSVYQRLRAAVDGAGHPLISVEGDTETLLGKKIHICPSLQVVGGSPASNSTLIFGDLSAFHVRCSRPTLQRAINAAGTAEYGKALFITRIRMDACYFDPSGGTAPPLIAATITA